MTIGVKRCQMTDLLIDFTWHRDRKGYRIADFNFLNLPWRLPQDDPWRCIVPVGRRRDLINYQPFARRGDLCLVFAQVTRSDQLLRFINNYGPLNDYYSRLGDGRDWEYGENNLVLSSPNPFSYITSSGISSYWRCKDGTEVPADFIPGDPVPNCLRAAAAFRELLRLKARGRLKELSSLFHTSFFDSANGAFPACQHASVVDFAPDPKVGIRLRLKPPTLLGALWYQLGITLSGNTGVKMCRHCRKFFEVGQGTGLRSDAEFCCNEHKVEYFNWKRPASRKRKAKHGRTGRQRSPKSWELRYSI
jgi:hypothetical protein